MKNNELYFIRKMDNILIKWKENNYRKPLLLTGIRGAGKTTTVLHFANNTYKNVLYIDLESEEGNQFIEDVTFSHARTEEAFTNYINKYSQKYPNIFIKKDMRFTSDENTLLILDEIQNSSTAISFSLWYSSVISSNLIVISSAIYKAGKDEMTLRYAEREYMGTMSFEEFQMAAQYEVVRDKSFNPALYSYCKVGGFPEVVKDFCLSKNWKITLANTIKNLEKDLTDVKLQRLNADYLFKFLCDLTAKTHYEKSIQLKALAQEVNKTLYPLIRITELEVYTLLNRLKELGILKLVEWKNKDADETFCNTICFSDLGFLTNLGNTNTTITLENFLYKAFSSIIDDDIKFYFIEDCEAGFSLVINNASKCITKEIKINAETWNYSVDGKSYPLNDLVNTIVDDLLKVQITEIPTFDDLLNTIPNSMRGEKQNDK